MVGWFYHELSRKSSTFSHCLSSNSKIKQKLTHFVRIMKIDYSDKSTIERTLKKEQFLWHSVHAKGRLYFIFFNLTEGLRFSMLWFDFVCFVSQIFRSAAVKENGCAIIQQNSGSKDIKLYFYYSSGKDFNWKVRRRNGWSAKILL